MKQSLMVFVFTLAMALAGPLMAADPAYPPTMPHYTATPFWLESKTVPNVLLVLERDWKMFYPAYNNLSDLDGDGVIDIGFNPAVTYVGYFDPDTCYYYNPVSKVFLRQGNTSPQTLAELKAVIPDIIKKQGRDTDGDGLNDVGLKTPRSKHGVCVQRKDGAYYSDLTDSGWSGNWLNYAMTSRMDAIRKVLYGGKRYIDTPEQTVLELTSFLPGNSHTWGGELWANDLWGKNAKTSPWYDVASFTGYKAPEDGKVHFWSRSSYYGTNININFANSGAINNAYVTNQGSTSSTYRKFSDAPLFQFAANIPASNWHPRYITPLRIWDWVGDHGGGTLPNDWNLGAGPDSVAARAFMQATSYDKTAGQAARRFVARVETCNQLSSSPNQNCRWYGNSYKPIGLLQEYGENNTMYFGLLTGTLNASTRYEGGVMRHHIQDFNSYIDVSTGQVKRPGLIDTIDRFQVTGIGTSSGFSSYTDGTQAGNPLGEMVYEGVRYMSRITYDANPSDNVPAILKPLTPTKNYMPASESSLPSYDRKASASALPRLGATDWAKLETSEFNASTKDCPKPIILLLSEVFPDHDYNATTFNSNQSEFNNTPLLSQFLGSGIPKNFDIRTYLAKITDQEKLKSGSGELFFYPQMDPIVPGGKSNRGVCQAHKLPGGLQDINGHCPSEPSLGGSYALAAIAYYAHTHNMYNIGGKAPAGDQERFIDLYGVGIPGNFPDITFEVDDQRSLTLMPITVALDNVPGDDGSKLRTLINFYVESWEVDANKRPFRVKFATNFEYNTTPSWASGSGSNNMERDILNRFEITLLTDSDTPTEYREAKPIFINSGPFRTRNLAQWESDKKNYENCLALLGNNQNDCYGKFPVRPATPNLADNAANNQYYYAFREPAYDPEYPNAPQLDLSDPQLKIVGVTVYNNSHGSYINMKGHGGYTVTGVEHPGAYIDVGYYGNDAYGRACKDAAFYNNTTCFGNKPIIMEGDYNYGAATCNQLEDTDYYYRDRRGLPPGYCNPYYADELMTPWECPFSGYTNSNRNDADVTAAYGSPGPDASKVCGRVVGDNAASANTTGAKQSRDRGYMRYVQVRSFKFDENAPEVTPLPNPMKLAAKYGGFKDSDSSGSGLAVPDKDHEWKRLDGSNDQDDPYNYFEVANISDLPHQLGRAFETISNSVATGTANSASINTILGGGISLQTQYRTEYSHPRDPETVLKWTGNVFAFFTDKWGNLRADTDGDQKLSLVTAPANGEMWEKLYKGQPYRDFGDKIVHVVSGDNDMGTPTIYLCRDIYGNNNDLFYMPADKLYENNQADYPAYADCQRVESFEMAKPLWNVAEQLAKLNIVRDNRDVRNPYTSFGKNKDGSPNITLQRFMPNPGVYNHDLHDVMGMSSLTNTFYLLDYIRGIEISPAANRPPFRNRTAFMPWYDSSGKANPLPASDKQVWRLGDVINSKPVIVGNPGANYHLSYGSRSYGLFDAGVGTYRRNMAYFGANDGMLHAINLGFFGSLEEGKAGYSKDLPEHLRKLGGAEYANFAGRPLGDELWSYVPGAVLPHLKWLSDPNYEHSYYVDMEPLVTDITDENGQWRTIMIVGLRQGGRTIDARIQGAATPSLTPDYSYSEFTAFDITNPDENNGRPKLLWRFSHPNLGLTTSMPAIVRSDGQWYAVLASGPTSDTDDPTYGRAPAATPAEGRMAYEGRSTQKARLFVLNARNGQLLRDPNSTEEPNPLILPVENSFFTDTFTPRARHIEDNGESWSHHTVYMGMTAADSANRDVGAVYRLQMVNPSDGAPLPVNEWKLTRMFNADKPVTGSVNSFRDNNNNLWVVFGTGRTWYNGDLAPCGANAATAAQGCCDNHEQYIYGLKEPLNDRGLMTFEEISEGGAMDLDITDVSGVQVYKNGRLDPPAVSWSGSNIISHEDLYNYMTSKDSSGRPVVRGYKRKLESWRSLSEPQPNKTIFELVVSQPQVDFALATQGHGRANVIFTSYRTSANYCEPSGVSFLNVIDGCTGLPDPSLALWSGFDLGSNKEVVTAIKKAGAGMASEAWVTESAYGNTSFNSRRNMAHPPAEFQAGPGVISWREVLDMGFDLGEDGDEENLLFDDLK